MVYNIICIECDRCKTNHQLAHAETFKEARMIVKDNFEWSRHYIKEEKYTEDLCAKCTQEMRNS